MARSPLSSRPGLRAVVLATLGLIAAAAPAAAKELYERSWLEARSPNFVVVSALGKKANVALVQELEDFRQVVALFTNAGIVEPRVPTWLFVFPGEVEALGLSGDVGGFFLGRMRANYAAIRPSRGLSLAHVIQHEYTHFLVHNQSRLLYPRWYQEGFAELLSTVNLRGGRFDLGNAATGRVYALRDPLAFWLPFDRLLDDEQFTKLTDVERQRYYSQAWALVHYLSWGKPAPSITDGLAAYLAAREAGTATVPAFEGAFDEDAGQLAKAVIRYLERDARYHKGTLRRPFPAEEVRLRTLRRDEVAALLGDFCIAAGNLEAARSFVSAALEANPRSPMALVGKADLDRFAGRHPEAEALYPQAIALEPDNDLHHLDFGEYWLDRAEAADDTEQRKRSLSKARAEFVLANKLNDRNPETLAMYGSSFLLEGEDPARGLETLEYAHELLPSEPGIKMLLAQLYIAVERPDDARALLRAVATWEHGNEADVARNLLARLEQGETPLPEPPAEHHEAGTVAQ
ncbi:MAG: tetratricopeptide repeat protein [Gammaproteobacteria bacterium]|nr:tetratricopeptide repeat protein [Gammaproteobacteria bacterium]